MPWEGYRESQLPTGVWTVSWAFAGDGTGGARTARLIFKVANVTVPNQLYSLEALVLSGGNNTGTNAELATSGFAHTFGSDWGAQARLEPGQVSARGVLRDMVAIRGTFLGEITKTIPAIAFLQISITNANGVTFAGHCSGWIWGPESKSWPGGPQRPGAGVFPA